MLMRCTQCGCAQSRDPRHIAAAVPLVARCQCTVDASGHAWKNVTHSRVLYEALFCFLTT